MLVLHQEIEARRDEHRMCWGITHFDKKSQAVNAKGYSVK